MIVSELVGERWLFKKTQFWVRLVWWLGSDDGYSYNAADIMTFNPNIPERLWVIN